MTVLRYDFSIVGQKSIDRAFASIERRAVQHNTRMAREFGQTRKTTTRGASPARVAAQRVSAERQVQRAQERTQRHREAALKRQSRLEFKHYRQRIDGEKRAAAAAIREQKKVEAAQRAASLSLFKEQQRARKTLMGRIGSSAGRTSRAVAGTVGGAAVLGGGFMASAAIGQQMRESAVASRLANQAGDPSIKGQLLRESQGVRGFTGEEALGGLESFVDLTGDLDTARKLMGELSQLSLATGSNLEDVAAAAGNFSNNLKDIEDPGKRAAAIMEAMRAVAGQGLAGAVELKDLASSGATLGAAASMMGGDSLNNIKSAGVLAQAARAEGGADSADMATRATARFMDFAAKNSGRLESQLGIQVANRDASGGVTSVRSPRELIADYLQATNGDLSKVTKDFGEMGGRVVKGFASHFRSGGREGVLERFDELMKTELKGGDITQRASSRLADPDLQFKEVLKNFNAQVGADLLPALTKLIPEFAKLLPHIQTATRLFAKLVESFANNPLLTIGQMIAGKVALDIATARIGDTVKNALINGIGGGTVTGGGGTVTGTGGTSPKGGGLNLSGAVFNGVSLGVTGAMAIYSSGVVNFEAAEAQMDRAGARESRAREIFAGIERGEISKTDGAKMLRELSREARAETDKITESNSAVSETTRGIGSHFGTAVADAASLLPGVGGLALAGRGVAGEAGADVFESIAETIGISNKVQQKTNEKMETTIDKFSIAAGKLERAAEKIDNLRPPQKT